MSVIIATQGVQISTMLDALDVYMAAVTGLQSRYIIRWDSESRPNIEGRGDVLWYSLDEEIPDKSQGPGRWGNTVLPAVLVRFITRSMRDGAQRDKYKWALQYNFRWKLIQAFQNLNLFSEYAEQPALIAGETWQPPQPTPTAVPLTIEPMYLSPIARTDKNDGEEASMYSSLRVVLPMVLALTNGET